MNDQKPDLEKLGAMLEKAQQKLAAAEMEFKMGYESDSASRAYYAAYHAVYAVLAHHGLTFSSHAQVLGAFNKEFIKTGIFPPDTFKKLQKMFLDRNIAAARLLVDACRQYLEKAIGRKFPGQE
jgi:uncharacterized protein (UPF0332 family)